MTKFEKIKEVESGEGKKMKIRGFPQVRQNKIP